MRRRLLVPIAILASVFVILLALAPPGRVRLTLAPDARVVRGAIHVHTTVSDGAGTADEVAAAASRAALDFVVLTDHGDGTRVPVPPHYAHGVLMIDAVEVSTTGGHYLALGLGQTPYRLAGEPRDVIEDVTRLGGFGIAAHPDSPKPELSWREWLAPFEGIEWLNADSAWRDESRRTLARALVTYWLRRPEVIASLFDRPTTSLARWDAMNRRRPVVAVAGLDAHARIGPRGDWEPADGGYMLQLPSYAAALRAFSLSVALDAPLGRTDPIRDAATVMAAVRAGRVTTVIDAVAGPARLAFTASYGAGEVVPMGGEVGAGLDASLTATLTPSDDRAELRLVKDGVVVARGRGGAVTVVHAASAAPAVYRVEGVWGERPDALPVPWVLGNAIRVGFAPPRIRPAALPPPRWAMPVPVTPWRVEQHPASVTALVPTVLTPTNTAWTLSWRLGGGAPAGQYAAMAADVPAGFLRRADRLSFTCRSGSPMRVSVQLRVSATSARWRRSIYVAPSAAQYSIGLHTLTAVEVGTGPLDPSAVDAILFVVDTVNTTPGSAGEVWVSELRAEGVGQ